MGEWGVGECGSGVTHRRPLSPADDEPSGTWETVAGPETRGDSDYCCCSQRRRAEWTQALRGFRASGYSCCSTGLDSSGCSDGVAAAVVVVAVADVDWGEGYWFAGDVAAVAVVARGVAGVDCDWRNLKQLKFQLVVHELHPIPLPSP